MASSKRLNITQSERNAHWAISWIKTQEAKDYMRSVMMATTVSRRHKLFLKKSERHQSSPLCLSQLYKLSNPGFIGEGGGVSDIKIIKELIDNVFNVNFNDADTKLKQLGKNVAYKYTITVLFPETFIHYYQIHGKTREEAEESFLANVVVDPEEKINLTQEIQEKARNKKYENVDNSSEDDWVDHSDMERGNKKG